MSRVTARRRQERKIRATAWKKMVRPLRSGGGDRYIIALAHVSLAAFEGTLEHLDPRDRHTLRKSRQEGRAQLGLAPEE